MRVFIMVVVLIVPIMLLGVSCQKETPESKELAFERVTKGSLSEQPLYAEAEEHEADTMYESEEGEDEGQDLEYESEEEEEEDAGYEPEEQSDDEEPTYESDADEHA